MKSIYAQLFGEPLVKVNGKNVKFPYKKSEGLFYYVCLNKHVSREDAINILWTDCNDSTARKNLRDAIYRIKRTLGDNIFLYNSKSIIELNEEIIEIDVDNVSATNILDIYRGHFLQNFIIKDCYDFENWTTEKRNYYKNIYLNEISKKINDFFNIGDFESIEKYSKILTENDPYNEKIYRNLMKLHALSGDYNKSIKLYYNLFDLLEKDLNVSPENKTNKIFKEILKLKNNKPNNSSKNYFYGRYNELFIIEQNIDNFMDNSGASMLITGEAGIGKTFLINKIISSLDMDKIILLNANCYNVEEELFLKPWNSIFTLLGNYIKANKIKLSPKQLQIINYIFPSFTKNKIDEKYDDLDRINSTRYELAEKVIMELFNIISANKKIMLIFDDLQWMDKMSKLLLSNIITYFNNSNVILIGAYREDFENKLSPFLVPLIKMDLIHKIELKRFTYSETKNIIFELLPNTIYNNDSMLKDIYSDTEGNPLFLIELLKVVKDKGYAHELSAKATNIIKSRIMDLTKNEMLLLNIISLFFDKASIDCLKFLVPLNDFKFFDVIESLQEKKLIQESTSDKDVFYSFTHQKIREFVYKNQSKGKKIMLHEKIGNFFEESFKISKNKHLYTNLIYHFEKSGNKYKSLKYKIENLTDYYSIYHETYPIFSENNYAYTETNETEDFFNVEKKFIEILNELKNLNNIDSEYLKLIMEVLYLFGRYYISMGEYDKGLNNIEESMRIAEKLNNINYLLNNFKQMIFYSIQVNDIETMIEYINKSMDILNTDDNIEERGIILRLKGLYCIKINDYNNADKLLNEAINIFTDLNKISNKYKISISACYAYLGQANKELGKYEIAYDYYKKAVNLSSDNFILKGMEIFYSNIGQVLYEMGRINEAEEFIYKSIDIFEKYNNKWGRDIAECYACLIEIKKDNISKAQIHLEIARELANKLNNPKSLELVKSIERIQ
jgi:DNA-binding SARP family transcriptional activator